MKKWQDKEEFKKIFTEKAHILWEKELQDLTDKLRLEEARRAVIGEYLMSVLRGAPTVMAGGGTHVPAPERRPRDLGEAARLAAELFSKGD